MQCEQAWMNKSEPISWTKVNDDFKHICFFFLGQTWVLAILCLIENAEFLEQGGDIEQPAYMLTPFLELKYPEYAGPAANLPGCKVRS